MRPRWVASSGKEWFVTFESRSWRDGARGFAKHCFAPDATAESMQGLGNPKGALAVIAKATDNQHPLI